VTITDFLSRLRWLDGRPLLSVIEPYRLRLLQEFFERDRAGRLRRNLGLWGRAKKNWKTADLVTCALYAIVDEPAPGYDADASLLANDKDQAAEDLGLAKKIVNANPVLLDWLKVKRDVIERRDARGFLEILPAGDVAGAHGKSRRFVGYDEIHGYRTWDVFEAMQPDPHRLDAQQLVTSYASLIHRPGVPLFDLIATGKAGTDARMLFSWYAADFSTDPDFADKSPEQRANPSMASWADPDYLAQQQRRLPAHKYRRLHLNLPGLPEGSAFAPEPVMDAIDRGVRSRPREAGVAYAAFVDMSGGSSDDAYLGIGYSDAAGRKVLAVAMDQGQRAPFDPNKAVDRFVTVLRAYGITRVTGDKYAGTTFQHQFESAGITYLPCDRSKSELYEALEPELNGRRVWLLDIPVLEQQLLGLQWRGGRIDHPHGEHDDCANAVAGTMAVLASVRRCTSPLCDEATCDGEPPFGLLFSDANSGWRTNHPSPAEVAAARAATVDAESREDAPAVQNPVASALAAVQNKLRALVTQKAQQQPEVSAPPVKGLRNEARTRRQIERERAKSSGAERDLVVQERRARSAREVQNAIDRKGHWWPGE
jgi:hypothetical protein